MTETTPTAPPPEGNRARDLVYTACKKLVEARDALPGDHRTEIVRAPINEAILMLAAAFDRFDDWT